jgi:hypothetical protein
MKTRLLFGTTVLGVLVAASGTVFAATPQSAVIRLSDLRPGYSQEILKRIPATRVGQIGGWETKFSRDTFAGVAYIDDYAYSYTSSVQAVAGYNRSLHALLSARIFKQTNWHAMSAAPVGNVRQAYTAVGSGGGWPMTVVGLIFRRNNMVGILLLGGIRGYDPAKVFDLARLMDGRMQR